MTDSISCSHASLGCEWQGQQDELQAHLSSKCAVEPLKGILYKLSNRVSQLTEETERLKRELEELKLANRPGLGLQEHRGSITGNTTIPTDSSFGNNDTSSAGGNSNRMSISAINNPWQLDQPLTWDRASSHASTEFSNDDLTIVGKERNVTAVTTQPLRKGGIYYYEIKIDRDGIPTRIGLVSKENLDSSKSVKDQGWSCGSAGDLWIQGERVGVDFLTWKSGDTIGVLVDMVDKVMWMYKNKILKGVVFKYFPDDMYPAVTVNNGTCTVNFNAHVENAPEIDTSSSTGPVRISKTKFKDIDALTSPDTPTSASTGNRTPLETSITVNNPWTESPIWDKTASHASFTISEDALTIVGKDRNVTAVATQPLSDPAGKYYFEFKDVKNGMPTRLGFVDKIGDTIDVTKSIKDLGWSCGSGGDVWIKGEQVRTDYLPWRSGDRIGFLVDVEERQIYIYKNGQCKGIVFQFFPDNLYPAVTINYGTCELNFTAPLENPPTRDEFEAKVISRKKTRKVLPEEEKEEQKVSKELSEWDAKAPNGWDKSLSHPSFEISSDLLTLQGKDRNVLAMGIQAMKADKKYYFEIEDIKDGVPSRIGIVGKEDADNTKSIKDVGWSCGSAGDLWIKGEKVGSDFLTWKSGDKIGVLVNVVDRTVALFKNGQYKGVAFKYFPDNLYPAVSINQGTCKITFATELPAINLA